jgi:hypothetical protein
MIVPDTDYNSAIFIHKRQRAPLSSLQTRVQGHHIWISLNAKTNAQLTIRSISQHKSTMVMHIDQGDTKSNEKWMRNDNIVKYSMFY